MTYILRFKTTDVNAEELISSEEYVEIVKAREGLFELLAVEEKYDLLIRNYLAFERALYESTINNLMFRERSWSDMTEYIQAINLPLMNLLAICGSYIYHIPQHISSIFPEEPEKENAFHEERKNVYASTLGYRALYEIRNYVQHRGLPVYAIDLDGGSLEGEEARRHTVAPSLSIKELKSDPGFNKEILKELQAIGENVDLRILVRENMSGFGRIHKFVRTLTATRSVDWDSVISNRLEDFTLKHGQDIIGFEILKLDEQEKAIESFFLFDHVIKRRSYLEQKNKTLPNVEKHFIAGQIKENTNGIQS